MTDASTLAIMERRKVMLGTGPPLPPVEQPSAQLQVDHAAALRDALARCAHSPSLCPTSVGHLLSHRPLSHKPHSSR